MLYFLIEVLKLKIVSTWQESFGLNNSLTKDYIYMRGVKLMDEKLKSNISELITWLDQDQLVKIKAIIGLDGFADEIVHVVDTRKNASEFSRIKTLREYGERIVRAAGLSTNIELVTMQCKLGGNGPIFSNSLVAYGLDVT